MKTKLAMGALMCLVMVTAVTAYSIAPAGASSIGTSEASRDKQPIDTNDEQPDEPRSSGGGGSSKVCDYWVEYDGIYPVQKSMCYEPDQVSKTCRYWMAGPGFC